MTLHQSFTGGNIRVLREEGDTFYLNNELRDTQGDWFYWAFCVEGAQGKTLSFRFPQNRVGYFGPAVSHDLREWHWLNKCEGEGFTYTFGENEDKVYFAHSMLYHPERFLEFASRHHLPVKELCKSQAGHSVPCVTFGEGDTQILLTCRHHACESSGNFVLEGVLEELLAHPIPDTTVFCVPFVDYDGVVNGDQGKGRAPHDHNRDYDPAVPPIYPTTAAIQAYAEERGCHWGFDFHSPWHLGGANDCVFIVQNSTEKLDALNAFGATLEAAMTPGAYPYRRKNDFPYLKDWNQPSPNFGRYMTCRPENHLAFSLETAYFGTPDRPVSDESLVETGRCFAKALTQYISK